MQDLQRGPGSLTGADRIHRRLILGAPVVGQPYPVGSEAVVAAESLQLPDQAGAPIDDGSENVEQNGFGHGKMCPLSPGTFVSNREWGLLNGRATVSSYRGGPPDFRPDTIR